MRWNSPRHFAYIFYTTHTHENISNARSPNTCVWHRYAYRYVRVFSAVLRTNCSRYLQSWCENVFFLRLLQQWNTDYLIIRGSLFWSMNHSRRRTMVDEFLASFRHTLFSNKRIWKTSGTVKLVRSVRSVREFSKVSVHAERLWNW